MPIVDAPKLGAHMSIAGGPAKALERGHSIHCDTIQLFTRNANQWRSKELTGEQIAAFQRAREETGICPIVAHSSYLINLASPDADLRRRSLEATITELRRCEQLGIADYVLHPGSHRGEGARAGLARIAEGLTRALEATREAETVVLLETTAGQGDGIGCRFEHLAWLIGHIEPTERVGVCFDTAHVLASGYEFRQPNTYAILWQHFHEVIGLERLRAIHLNDSKRDLGSQVDRHEQIGQGCVGVLAFRMLVNDPALRHVPMILETPKGPDLAEDIANLALLRSLMGGGGIHRVRSAPAP